MRMEHLNTITTKTQLSLKIRLMLPDDIHHGMKLSAAEAWNQTENDWRILVDDAENICLLAEADGKVIGTTTAINYENREAWIGMVLVDKDYRGLGVSKSLLSAIFEKLSGYPSVKLDATPAGQLVYQKFGFKDEYTIGRMVNPSLSNLPLMEIDADIEPIQLQDMDEIISLDKTVFGTERTKLIRALVQNHPDKAWMLKRKKKVVGFVLGRDGSRFFQIGPLVASNINDAKYLLAKAMQPLTNQSIVVDVLFDKPELIEWLNNYGFTTQRHFIRMFKERNPFPGETDKLYLISGPEFG